MNNVNTNIKLLYVYYIFNKWKKTQKYVRRQCQIPVQYLSIECFNIEYLYSYWCQFLWNILCNVAVKPLYILYSQLYETYTEQPCILLQLCLVSPLKKKSKQKLFTISKHMSLARGLFFVTLLCGYDKIEF